MYCQETLPVFVFFPMQKVNEALEKRIYVLKEES